MTNNARFSTSGWRNKVLDLPPQDDTRPTVVEFRGGWFTSQYHLHALRNEKNQEAVGPYLAAATGRERNRFVLPADCNRLRVRRFITSGNSIAIGPWHLRTVPLEELTPLSDGVKGKHCDLLFHSGQKAELRFEWEGDNGGTLFFEGFTGKGERQLTQNQALRGTVTLPSEGLLRIQGHGRWRLNLIPRQR